MFYQFVVEYFLLTWEKIAYLFVHYVIIDFID